jgi:hypothetical protein
MSTHGLLQAAVRTAFWDWVAGLDDAASAMPAGRLLRTRGTEAVDAVSKSLSGWSNRSTDGTLAPIEPGDAFRAGLRTAANELPAYDSCIGCDNADVIASAIMELTESSDPGPGKEDMIRRGGLKTAPDTISERIAEDLIERIVMRIDEEIGDDPAGAMDPQALKPMVAASIRIELPSDLRITSFATDEDRARETLREVDLSMSALPPKEGEDHEALWRRRLLETMARGFAAVRRESVSG